MTYVLLVKGLYIRRNPTAPGRKEARIYIPTSAEQTSQYDDKNFLYDAELSRASGHTKKKQEVQRNMSKPVKGGYYKHGKPKKVKLGKKSKNYMSEAHPSPWASTI